MNATRPRILVVRFSAIGDCVMAAWAATAIRQKYPDAFLAWAVEGRCAPVIDRHRLVTQRIEFPRDRWRQSRWTPATWREQLLKHTNLRKLRFDWGVDLQGHSKTAICLRIARPKRRLAAAATDAFSRSLNPQAGPRPEGLHDVEWQNRVINQIEPFELPVRPWLPEVGGESDPRRVTIAVSAGQADKAYPIAQWEQVAARLIADGWHVTFVGGKHDPHPNVAGADDQVGELRLKDTMRLIQSSALHLAADTGTGHMAAGLGVPVISVFGPTDPQRYRPYSDRGVVLRAPSRVTADVTADEVLAAVAQHAAIAR
ncbi:MAG: glycosyltransferase family 9 protein [Fimbriimonadaceae bacterium]|nr:glycosyltransferase family 9 protein [Fimbriimonadaceae bacterium]